MWVDKSRTVHLFEQRQHNCTRLIKKCMCVVSPALPRTLPRLYRVSYTHNDHQPVGAGYQLFFPPKDQILNAHCKFRSLLFTVSCLTCFRKNTLRSHAFFSSFMLIPKIGLNRFTFCQTLQKLYIFCNNIYICTLNLLGYVII